MGEKGNLTDAAGIESPDQAVAQRLTSAQQQMTSMSDMQQGAGTAADAASGTTASPASDSATRITGAVAPLLGDDKSEGPAPPS